MVDGIQFVFDEQIDYAQDRIEQCIDELRSRNVDIPQGLLDALNWYEGGPTQ